MKKFPSLKKHVKAAPAKTVRTRKLAGGAGKTVSLASKSVDVSDTAFRDIVASFLQEISFQGGLNVNVNLTIQFKGLG